MSVYDKLIGKILSGRNDRSFRFVEVTNLLKVLGFNEKIKGDHFIFYRDGIDEIINVQPKNAKVKPYQLRQIRNLIIKYRLEITDDK